MDRDNKPFILFVTGVSAAGKTTVYEGLKEDRALKNIEVRDLDENGVPLVGLTPWRAFRVEELFYQAVNSYKKGKSTIICGVTFPGEVIESKYYQQKYNVHFLLLTLNYETFKTRIDERILDAEKTGEVNESLKKGNYRDLLSHTKRLINKFENIVANLRNGYVIDTSNMRKEELLDNTKKIVKQISIKS
jgi:broad-specificity NMP kinase